MCGAEDRKTDAQQGQDARCLLGINSATAGLGGRQVLPGKGELQGWRPIGEPGKGAVLLS